MRAPTFEDVLLARQRIAPYLRRTPMHAYPAVNDLIGTEVFIKHENYQPVGSFKVRGGVNLISQLSEQERTRGVIAASTGPATMASPSRLRRDCSPSKRENANAKDVTPFSLAILQGILRVAGLNSALISSTARKPAQQARVMYDNLQAHGVAQQKALYRDITSRYHSLLLRR